MLDVIGVGFGRTGTMSLKLALESLGFAKCYHFSEMLKARHVSQWLKIADNATPDWESLFSGYRATTDWPAAACYRELATAYPNAAIILTVRDADDWYDSFCSSILRLRKAMPVSWPFVRKVAAVSDHFVFNGVFMGRADDREYAIAKYQEHIEAVQKFVPAERLLVFNVRDGWAPLCRFLEVDVPKGMPFPRVNDRREFLHYIRLMSVLRIAPLATAIIIMVIFAVLIL